MMPASVIASMLLISVPPGYCRVPAHTCTLLLLHARRLDYGLGLVVNDPAVAPGAQMTRARPIVPADFTAPSVSHWTASCGCSTLSLKDTSALPIPQRYTPPSAVAAVATWQSRPACTATTSLPSRADAWKATGRYVCDHPLSLQCEEFSTLSRPHVHTPPSVATIVRSSSPADRWYTLFTPGSAIWVHPARCSPLKPYARENRCFSLNPLAHTCPLARATTVCEVPHERCSTSAPSAHGVSRRM
mmetsp:Transcript_1244/g.5069  ORF Transcript_1244/g.5069 Transcript_1244/m.5069 type:complete len:245 (+) Transcript_1244:194-928(+)